jgi:site-specific recombinase XerD
VTIAIPELPAPPVLAERSGASPYAVYLLSLDSEESRRGMRGCLDHIARIMAGVPGAGYPWAALRYDSMTAIRALIVDEGKSPSHVNKHLSALRGVLREAWRLDLMSAEDYQRARDVKNVSAHREPAGRSINGDEISAMLAVCASASGLSGIRDAALISLLQSTGIRRAEAASALIERYDPGERTLRVIGKGNKERTVYVHRTSVPALDRWLVAIGERRGPMFRPVDKWGNVSSRALIPWSVGQIINRRREQAGLSALSTHDFRRTFIGDFLDAGGDLAQAQQLAGHSLVTTTASYDRRPGRKLRTAVDKMELAR